MFRNALSVLRRVWSVASDPSARFNQPKYESYKKFVTPSGPSQHMGNIFSQENFHAFAKGYLDGDLSGVVNDFIYGANTGRLKNSYVFWMSREEENLLEWKSRPRYLRNFRAKNRVKPKRGPKLEKSACFYEEFNRHSFKMEERPKGVSPFSDEEAKALAHAMKDHPYIVNAMIVMQKMLYEYFISVARKHGAEDVVELARDAKTNNFFAELIPHIIKVAEREGISDLRKVFRKGVNEAARNKVFSSFQNRVSGETGEICGMTITRCPFSDFVMGVWSGEDEKVGALPVLIVQRLKGLRADGVEFDVLSVP